MMKKNTLVLLLNAFIDQFGTGFTKVGVLIYAATKLSLGGLTLSVLIFTIPNIVLGVPIGKFVDHIRWPKYLLLLAQFVAAVVSMMLFIVSKTSNSFAFFMLLLLLIAACELADPVLNKIVVLSYSKDRLGNVNSLLSGSATVANIISSMIATALVSLSGVAVLFLVDAASYLICFISIMFLDMHLVAHDEKTNVSVEKIKTRMPRTLVQITWLACFVNLFLSSFSIYLTKLTEIVFHQVDYIGVLESLFSIGILLGTVVYPVITSKLRIKQALVTACTLIAVCYFIMNVGKAGVVLGVVLLGIALPIFNIAVKTYIQQNAPINSLGSIYTSFYAILNVASVLGVLLVPLIINYVGIRNFLQLSSLLILSVTVLWFWTMRISWSAKRSERR